MYEPTSVVSSIYRSGRLYDLYFPHSPESIDDWLTLAHEIGDPILEIMCGTGALAIPLAQQGHRVTGLELAAPMLEEAKRKSTQAGVSVEWITGDARNFELAQQFRLIYLASNSICHLLTRADLEACLAAVLRHLHPAGRFIVSVFVPSLPLLMKTPDDEEPFTACLDPVQGEEIVITQRSWYDAATQLRHSTLYKRVGNGPVEPDGELTMRMFFPQELDALLEYSGFVIEHKYGGSDRRPFDASSTMQLYLLKPR